MEAADWIKTATDLGTLFVTAAPLLAWVLRLFSGHPLVLVGRRSGQLFRFELHNVVPVPYEGDIEVLVEVLDAKGGFLDGVAPVLLCGPRSVDVDVKAENARTFRITARRIRPLAAWTIVTKCNVQTSEVKATLLKPSRAVAVASEQETQGATERAPWRDLIWPALALASYVLLVRQADLREGGSYTFVWLLTDIAASLIMLSMIGAAYQLCVRKRQAPVLLQGYVGLDESVPSDDGESAL
jgi:hypothetical protein